jgi:SAM-dependent methyltransferase
LDTRARFVASAPNGGVLLDLGSSDGATLRHFYELRSDLQYVAADIAGQPENYPPGVRYCQVNLEKDHIPLPDGSVDAVTCMHLVEHLRSLDQLFKEIRRVLSPRGRVYFETPHPRSLAAQSSPPLGGNAVPTNFFDDDSHVRLVTPLHLVDLSRKHGLLPEKIGVSRNWLIAASYAWYCWHRPSRYRQVAYMHVLGWSSYLIARAADGKQA